MTAPETIRRFNEENHRTEDVLFVRLLRAKGMTDEQIAGVIEAVWEVCPDCYDGIASKCYCMADD